MRLLAALSAALRAIALVPLFVWEGSKWMLRMVSGRQPDPVLPATAVASDYLDATATPTGPRLATVDGVPVRSETGVTLVLAARHTVAGGPAVELTGLPDEVQVWLASLTEDELHVLSRTPPHVAEAVARGEPVLGLPPLLPDMSAPVADMSGPTADVSEDQAPTYVWPEGDEPSDEAMRSLFDQLEAKHRRRTA